MKRRVCVLRLQNGGYLNRDGSDNFGKPRVEMYWNDMCLFLRELRLFDRQDVLFGASMEVLEKRKTHHPLSSEEVTRFIAWMKLVRLENEAAKYDRFAEGYQMQENHAVKMAADMRAKAVAIRELLKEKK